MNKVEFCQKNVFFLVSPGTYWSTCYMLFIIQGSVLLRFHDLSSTLFELKKKNQDLDLQVKESTSRESNQNRTFLLMTSLNTLVEKNNRARLAPLQKHHWIRFIKRIQNGLTWLNLINKSVWMEFLKWGQSGQSVLIIFFYKDITELKKS